MSNLGGFSLSRILGITTLKSRISRHVGIPMTESGRQRKIGRTMLELLFGKRKPVKEFKPDEY